MGKKFVASYSGGKDSILAIYWRSISFSFGEKIIQDKYAILPIK